MWIGIRERICISGTRGIFFALPLDLDSPPRLSSESVMSERYSDCAMRELEAAQAETERGAAFEALVASAKANEKLAAAVLRQLNTQTLNHIV